MADRREAWLEIVSGRRRGPAADAARAGLALLTPLYRAGLGVRRLVTRTKRVSVPVLSVGNVTVGGTGKTPMAALLATTARAMGGRPVIVSRGYGAAPGRPNDEARELEILAPGVPHVQGADRWHILCEYARREPCDLAILDDGFQHHRLGRDLDLVLIDALCPFGYGHVLPRGLLRESLSALRRADLVVITRVDLVDREEVSAIEAGLARRLRPGVAVLTAAHVPARLIGADGHESPPEDLAGRDVAAVCGLGNPEGFRRTLETLGAHVRRFDAFPDHHAYTPEQLGRIREAADDAGAKTLVTTVKDYVKWRPFLGREETGWGPAIAALEIRMQMMEGEDRLRRAVQALLSG